MTKSDIAAWTCPTCLAGATRHLRKDNESKCQNTDDVGRLEEPSLKEVLDCIMSLSTKVTDVICRLDKLEKTTELQTMKHDDVLTELKEQRVKMTEIESSLEHMSAQYDSVLEQIKSHNDDLKGLQEKSISMEKALVTQQSELDEVKYAVLNLEEYSRRRNIEIHGVPQVTKENLRNTLKLLAERLELAEPLDEHVEAIHRIKAKEGMVPPILVRFASTTIRDLWLKKRTALKEDSIYINENLTAHCKTLLWLAKKQAKEKSYKFAWVRNGKVFVRKQEGAPFIRITKMDHLKNIK